MQNRNAVFALGLSLVAIIAAVAVLVWPRASAAQDNGTDSRKRITVVGHGEVSVAPDIASITIGVQSQAIDAKSALSDNNQKMQALIDQIKAAGVDEKDIQTNGFYINPQYDYNKGNGEILGYQVNNSVQVRIKVVDSGDLLDKVVEVGANNVGGIAFEVSDDSAALESARKAAIADAQLRAGQYASASNASVGEVLVITEQVGSIMQPMPMLEARDSAAGGVPIQAGTQMQTIDVQVTFELK